MIPNINEIAKQTLIVLKERKLKPTPENYTEIFEEISSKYGITSSNKIKLDKYKALLLPIYQQELDLKTVRNLEELVSFLISILNRQSGKQFSEFFELLTLISKILQISKDKKIKELARITSIRISKTMDSENIYLLSKKWKELENSYEESDLEEQLRKYGINKHDDYDSVIKKLLTKLQKHGDEYFAHLLSLGLKPSLVQDLKIQTFMQNLMQKPFIINEDNFKTELMQLINYRLAVDNMYVQKNLNFFNDNLKKIEELLFLLDKSYESNIDFIHSLKADENGKIRLSFEDLKLKFQRLGEKITSLHNQIQFAQNIEEREAWNVFKELDKMDENFNKYKVNYSLVLFSITNYLFIMEKYGIGSLNEIFVRFKKILKDSCSELDELWMIDEKSYLIISPGKSKDEMTQLIAKNLRAIENFRFIHKQDIITPKIHVTYLDKQSKPNMNLLEELMKQITIIK
ncbi:hypothetical protein N4T57_03690 [Campylobacter hepaticus]|uniref:GGDEF domain-containing protein n=1 Tax=Campylobacter hepaticus TaxID=1813019 RepID=A0A6A7JRH5_9BACT|nr:hypothetical protein [Campylobacter hepaticus]AXP08426.1 hypothetical protein A2J15_001540 [Campylobacter hepaticus]MCZ0772256.1 hypothetical protein [Campylobacter hepaticus]MCZ0773724.1 hypothetical protein [Campylobacter hepaticus]MCZ0774975.1 hypothetical protein [Campylobacter hepaticus]MDX2322843.1 hypothetical protein [Campylobacter hepaticus]